jgi:hypothetical protein
LVYADAPISEKDKTQSDGKVKPLRSKIGGNKVNPESPTKLATVPEQESAQAQEKEKSGSSIKRILRGFTFPSDWVLSFSLIGASA